MESKTDLYPYVMKDGETVLQRFKTKIRAIVEYAELLDLASSNTNTNNSKPFTLSHTSPDGKETVILEIMPTDFESFHTISEFIGG